MTYCIQSIYAVINKIPYGALTSKSYAFNPRPWELKIHEIFDPISEFFEPSLVGIANNKIQRVLPVNDFSNSFNSSTYNWISNRFRFLFDNILNNQNKNFLPLLPINFWIYNLSEDIFIHKSECVPTSWNFILNALGSKISNFRAFSHAMVSRLPSQDSDIYSVNSFYQLLRSKTNIFKFFEDYNFNTSKFNFFWPLMRNFANPNILDDCSSLILIGFNVYFLNPNLHYQIKKKVQSSRLSVYTFLAFNFGFNFNYKNVIPTSENIKMFFLGRHKWSKLGINKGSYVVLDYNILITWPEDIKSLIFQFWKKYPHNISLINNKNKFFFSPEYFGASLFLNFKDCISSSAYFPWSNFFFFMHKEFGALQNILNHSSYSKLFSFMFEGFDYKYIFDFNKINFGVMNSTQTNLLVNGNSNYFIPISGFGEFTSSYRIETPRVQHKVVLNTSKSKSFGQYFFLLRKILNKSKNYIHIFKFWNIGFFLFIFFWFFFVLHIMSTVINFIETQRLCKYLNNYYITKPAAQEMLDKIFFTYCKDNLYRFFYFNVKGSYRNMFKQVIPVYYFNWYVTPNLGFFSKSNQKFNSRTLLLDKNYFYSRFINFRK